MSYIWLQSTCEPNPDQLFLFAMRAKSTPETTFSVEKSRSS